MTDLPFQVGETYHRLEDIHNEYGGNRYRGISPTADYPFIFIFYGASAGFHGYDDEFTDDGRLLYTGEGREGDMTMDSGNAAIRDHNRTGEELHVFEIGDGPWEVTYVGEYEYVDQYWTRLPDRNGNMRDAVRFELVPKGGLKLDTGGMDPETISLDQLRDLAEASVEGTTQVHTSSTTTRYPRTEIVRKYALRRADGFCEACGEEAPFIDENGKPFLEVHHLYRRSDGGADHPDNVAAICPNCHRRVHYGRDGEEYNRQIIDELR